MTPIAQLSAASRHRRTPTMSELAVRGRRGADEHGAAERDARADQQPPWEALAEQSTGEQCDQDRPDVDQHRRCSGVHASFGGVQHDVVDREPRESADRDEHPLPARRPNPAAAGDLHGAEREASDQKPPEGERARIERVADSANGDERRCPRDHGERDCREHPPRWADRGERCACRFGEQQRSSQVCRTSSLTTRRDAPGLRACALDH